MKYWMGGDRLLEILLTIAILFAVIIFIDEGSK